MTRGWSPIRRRSPSQVGTFCMPKHTYDDTKDLHPYWPRRAEPSADALARMDEISDRMTELAELLDAADEPDVEIFTEK